MATWGSYASVLVFTLQILLCCHLYLTQVDILARLESLQPQTSVELLIARSRREVRSASEAGVENLVADENATAEVTTTTAAPSRRKHHRRQHRLTVEKYIQSTESTTMGPIMVRVSRTKSTQGRSRTSHRRIPEAAALREEPPAISGEFSVGGGGGNSELPPAVIHFLSDASNYTRERHPHYAGNGRIKVSGVYMDWRPAEWSHILGTDQHFRLDAGKVTIRQSGLYLLYAQIHYANVQEVNCYRALHNGVTVAQCCSTTAHPDRHEIKANTCNLLTTLYLRPSDMLWLADLHERYVILTPEKSYFGLVQLYSPQSD